MEKLKSFLKKKKLFFVFVLWNNSMLVFSFGLLIHKIYECQMYDMNSKRDPTQHIF